MLKLSSIWGKFAQYSKVIVSGPQRSGSTFAAFLIAKRLGYKWIDETKFNYSNHKLARRLLRKGTVIHCPALTHMIEDFAAEDTIIVFMIRDIKDIIASQDRINWIGVEELEKYNLSSGVISEIKYSFWEKQKKIIELRGGHYYELHYNRLAVEPEFVPKEKRQHFGPKQIL